jgi:polar amino acid transport system substrate-binding protein
LKNKLKAMKPSNSPILCWLASILFTFSLTSAVYAQNNITVLTDVWPPYINEQGQTKGSAAKLIELLFEYENINTDWHYLPYELSFHQVENKAKLVSFPYFKTKARENLVLFSEPVFSVTSKVYYNRQFLTGKTAEQAYKNKQRVGKVAGYSYGEAIDKDVVKAVAFASEKQALTALFNHDIDVLPMTEGVMNHHLTTNFPQRKELILSIKNISDTSSLHVVAAKTPEGQAVINKLNSALMSLKSLGMTSLQTTNTAAPSRIDIAKLITSEGYPSIIGQSASTGNNIEYFTLPQGSKALIIKWSNKILEPSKTDRIYKNMMDLSKVVILNGPHVGKELFVRNMHIELL